MIVLLATLGSASVRAEDILPVFVFAGQSNANGFGIPSQLSDAMKQPQKNVLFDNAFVNATPAWGPLTPPTEPANRYQFGGQYNIDYANGAFGAEITTGLGISKAMGGATVAEVKYSLGGTTLASDWNPDNPGGYKLYPSMVTAVNTAVAALKTQNPTKTVKIKGFFWMQGESDNDGPTYQTNLVNLIAHVRADFGDANLPFVFGQVGATWSGNAISVAQANVGTPGKSTYVHDTMMVTTSDLPIIFDNMHFNTKGIQKLGDRYAAAYEKLTGLPVQSLGISFADANLLKGANVVVSSEYSGFKASGATDGAATEQVFADGDNSMRMVIHGFKSGIKQLRIWRDTTDVNRVPAQVTIRSSTRDNAALGDTFETALVNSYTLGTAAFEDGCATVTVNAPEGTQSLFLDFGGVDANGAAFGNRIVEIQAFATPEPSTTAVVTTGLLSCLAYGWHRHQ
jgi:hypothetical protein